MSSNQRRQPEGTPAGGEFASTTHAEPGDVHLDSTPPAVRPGDLEPDGAYDVAAAVLDNLVAGLKDGEGEAWWRSVAELTRDRAAELDAHVEADGSTTDRVSLSVVNAAVEPVLRPGELDPDRAYDMAAAALDALVAGLTEDEREEWWRSLDELARDRAAEVDPDLA